MLFINFRKFIVGFSIITFVFTALASAVYVNLPLIGAGENSGSGSSAVTLISVGSTWKYKDDGSNQGTAWRDISFNDSSWASGSAQLGFGDGDEATRLSSGHITYYFRKSFNVSDSSQYARLKLELLRDDGAVVYLNGTEIERSNMPSGTISYTTFAPSTVSGSEEDAFFTSIVSASALVPGANILAVEIHQRSTGSSDISFDLSLKVAEDEDVSPSFRKEPWMIFTGNNTQMKVLWQLTPGDSSAGTQFEWGTDTSYSSENVIVFSQDDELYNYTISGLTPGAKYYYRITLGIHIKTGSFRAALPSEADSVRFFIYGDTRSYPSQHDDIAGAILSRINSDPDYQTMVISTGDFVNSGESEYSWDSELFDSSYTHIRELFSKIPYQAARGNHEGDAKLFGKYYPYLFEDSSGKYYSFDYGPAHFTVVDQYISYRSGSIQHNWIEQDLASTTKSWKFIYFHHGGWSAGTHSNSRNVQNYIQPLAEKYDVTAIFNGHNHNYARAMVNGIPHVTTGGGGAPLYSVTVRGNIITATSVHHYMTANINGDTGTFTAIKPNGTVIDQFTIQRNITQIPEEEDKLSEVGIPKEFFLHRVYPNPFNPDANIQLDLSRSEKVELKIYNSLGQLIRTLIAEETLPPGRYIYRWDSRNDIGEIVPSGIYLVQMKADDFWAIQRVVLVK